MFGCWAYYDDGDRLVWVSAARRDPWRGILVPTERVHHGALRTALSGLRTHPVLGKWLYLPARHEAFEAQASRLAEMIAARDARIGVEPTRRLARQPRKERSG